MNLTQRVLLVAGIVAVLIVAALVPTATETAPPVESSAPHLGADGAGSTWYCAEGTANPGGRAAEEIQIGNLGSSETNAVVSVDGGDAVAPVATTVTVAPGGVVRVPVASISAIAEPGVVVETTGGRPVVEHRITSATDAALGPCARGPSRVARFAAGTTARGAELWLALFNPYPDDAIVDITAITGSGVRSPTRLQGVVVPRTSRVSVAMHEAIPRVDTVATQVKVRRGRVVSEISQHLDGTDGRKGLALSVGADAARSWWFPTALNGSGHHERLQIANPGRRDARVRVTSALDAAASVEPEELLVPAESVVTADLGRIPPDIGFSLHVTSSRPVVTELVGASGSPQPADVQGIATDLGITAGAREWAAVPRRFDAKSTDVLAIVSTDGRAHRARVRAFTAAGRTVVVRRPVPARGRVVVDLAGLAATGDEAVLVTADGPVAVTRESTRPGLTRSHAVPR